MSQENHEQETIDFPEIGYDEHRATRLPKRTRDLLTPDDRFVIYDRILGDRASWKRRWVASDVVWNVGDWR